MPRATLSDRFWLRVDKRGAVECWPWQGHIHRLGYGRIGRGHARHAYAHRVSYELHYGAIPAGLDVLHSCDNRGCVNPAHLRVGTHTDNMRDMRERNRQNPAKGERCSGSKLTKEQVLAIRSKYSAGIGAFALAREYGITRSTVWHITTRRTWRHL